MRLWCLLITLLLNPLLSSLLFIVNAENIFDTPTRNDDSSSSSSSSTQHNDDLVSIASEAIHGLLQQTESELHKGMVVTAQLRLDPMNLSCLGATISLLDQTQPGGLAAPFESETALLCLLGGNDLDCDFSTTEFFTAAQANCAAAGGTFQSGDFYLCSEEFGTTGLGPDNNVKMSNVPVCVSPICSEGTTLQKLLQWMYEISGSDAQFEKTFTGQCAPSSMEIEWRIPTTPFAGRNVQVGATVVFNYNGFHNVYLHPSGNCDEVGSILVGDTNDGPVSYTFKADDAGSTLTFACDIGAHCEAGQIISFQVVEGTTTTTTAPFFFRPPTEKPVLVNPAPSNILSPEAFKAGIDNFEYDVILDVRSVEEWRDGHILGATFANSLASFGTSIHTGAKPSDFAGCELCTIAVYCRSGARAGVAIQKLLENGFEGQIYNAQGINQWQAAGFPLVAEDSVVPPCTTTPPQSCAGTLNPSSSPSKAPSGAPVLDLPIRKVPRATNKDGLKMNSASDFNQANGNRIRGGGPRRHLSWLYPHEPRSSD